MGVMAKNKKKTICY